MIELILTLIAFHFVADFPLQGDAIATGKNPNIDPAKHGVPWYYWMASHAATHAVAVGIATGSVWYALFEFCTHFAIDTGKCDKMYDIHVDQIFHILCKVLIAFWAFSP